MCAACKFSSLQTFFPETHQHHFIHKEIMLFNKCLEETNKLKNPQIGVFIKPSSF